MLIAGEVQACADAASERVQALEQQLDAQSSEAEAAATAAQAELESAQASAAATLMTTRAELKASLEAAETELASVKVQRELHSLRILRPVCLHLTLGMTNMHDFLTCQSTAGLI